MRRERVPEQMRMDMSRQALASRPIRDAQLYRAMFQPSAVLADEHRGLGRQSETRAFTQPEAQRRVGLATHGHDAGFSPLAQHAHSPVGKIERPLVEADEL